MWGPFFQGFGVSGGLIVAIGAQNAFVLSQGVRKNYHLLIALICSICDGLLITIGISGVGTVVAANPQLAKAAAWGGAAFLFWYGWKAFQSARLGEMLNADSSAKRSLRAVMLTTMAVTWLNPHCYIDTMLLIGSIGGQFDGDSRLFFGVGAVAASFIWFFSLSLFGRLLAPFFQKQLAWQILDALICIIMWDIAFSLLM
jgi:L-lysine exporter family protein LysE/ArgO